MICSVKVYKNLDVEEFQRKGSSDYISTTQEDKLLLHRQIASAEQFNTLCEAGDKGFASSWKATFIPIRTHDFPSFCQDFFVPHLSRALISTAFETYCIAFRMIFRFGAIIIDIISFPIRLLTVIPRCMYNGFHSKETNVFYQHLLQNGVDPQAIDVDYVILEVTESKPLLKKSDGAVRLDKDGVAKMKNSTSLRRLNFIELPHDESHLGYAIQGATASNQGSSEVV